MKHNEQLKLIEAGPQDLDDLMRFEKACFKEKPDQFPRRNLRHLITSPTSKTFVAKDQDGKIIAEVIGLLRHFKVPSGRVYKIAVDPCLQKKGMGSKLIAAIESWFVSEGMIRSCAEVRESNTASRTMFEKNGYNEAKTCYYYYVGGENAIKYWKDL